MCSRGIVATVHKNDRPLSYGVRNGLYIGAPGKDVYYVLPSLNQEQLNLLAIKTLSLFPERPPSNHVSYAAFIRYVYGCFEKQGCLRSKKDKQRMIEENEDWTLATNFMNLAAKHAEEQSKIYFLVLHYEMLGHRLGDRAIIEKKVEILQAMEENYLKSQGLSKKIRSFKHMFTPYYWCAKYYAEMKIKDKALFYHKRNLKATEKYCPDSRDGYKEKTKDSILYLKNNLDLESWELMKKWLSKAKNVCLKKVSRRLI